MMEADERLGRVILVVANELGKDAELISGDTRLEELDYDSLDRVELSIGLEEEFGLETIPDEEVEAWSTVQDVANSVQANRR